MLLNIQTFERYFLSILSKYQINKTRWDTRSTAKYKFSVKHRQDYYSRLRILNAMLMIVEYDMYIDCIMIEPTISNNIQITVSGYLDLKFHNLFPFAR